MFESTTSYWIVYYEPTGQNLGIFDTSDDAHLWIHEVVSDDMQDDCYVELVNHYSRR